MVRTHDGQPDIIDVCHQYLVFVVGTAMDLTPTVLILTPVLMPIVLKAGIDPVYFGVIFILNNAQFLDAAGGYRS